MIVCVKISSYIDIMNTYYHNKFENVCCKEKNNLKLREEQLFESNLKHFDRFWMCDSI